MPESDPGKVDYSLQGRFRRKTAENLARRHGIDTAQLRESEIHSALKHLETCALHYVRVDHSSEDGARGARAKAVLERALSAIDALRLSPDELKEISPRLATVRDRLSGKYDQEASA